MRKEIIKTREEINEIKTIKTLQKSNESELVFRKDKQNRPTFSQTHQKKERQDPD